MTYQISIPRAMKTVHLPTWDKIMDCPAYQEALYMCRYEGNFETAKRLSFSTYIRLYCPDITPLSLRDLSLERTKGYYVWFTGHNLKLIMKKRSTGQKHGIAVGYDGSDLLEILYIDGVKRLYRAVHWRGNFSIRDEYDSELAEYNKEGLLLP